jgi:hypothetical protein
MPDLCTYVPCQCLIAADEIFCSDICAMSSRGTVPGDVFSVKGAQQPRSRAPPAHCDTRRRKLQWMMNPPTA